MTDTAACEWRTRQLCWGELADDQNKHTWIKCLKVQYRFWTNLSFDNVVFQPLNSNLLAGTYYPSVIAKNPEKLHTSSQTVGVYVSAAWGCCKGCAIQFYLYWRWGRWGRKFSHLSSHQAKLHQTQASCYRGEGVRPNTMSRQHSPHSCNYNIYTETSNNK